MSGALKDCRECVSSFPRYGSLMCEAMTVPVPVEHMRRECSECGPEAMLFEPKSDKRYSEYE